MIRPASIFIGLRYLRSQRSNQFASFVTVASVLGVTLGVAALIVVLSVMNGFENELRNRLLSMMGHGTVLAEPDSPWREWLEDLSSRPGVEHASPFIEFEALLAKGRELTGVVLSGLAPELDRNMSAIAEQMRAGSLEALTPGSRSIVLGRALALKLGVGMGDAVTVLVPRKEAGRGLQTGLARFHVKGIFELGLRDHDAVRALVHLDDAAALTGFGDRISGVRVRAEDVFAAPRLLRDWAEERRSAGQDLPRVRDWTQDNATYFRAIRIEKVMMALLLSLIVAVAAFNIVATLVMVVTDKRGGIAILRTLGFSRRSIMAIFALQGLIVGWLGVVSGVALGIVMALNIDTLAPALERLFGFQFMPADVYYLTSLPADLQLVDVLVISVLALLLTGLATVYPSLRAASVAPAEVLRYES